MAVYSDFPFLEGPDQIKPADSFITWKPDGAVKLRSPIITEDGSIDEYVSIPTQLKSAATKYPDRVFVAYKVNEIIQTVTYSQLILCPPACSFLIELILQSHFPPYSFKTGCKEYENVCRTVAKAFLKLGLERYHSVCILGYNSPEWIYSALGAILAGGFEAGIYPTSSADACLYYLTLSRANIVVVEDDFQLRKILTFKHKLSCLKTIIQYSGKPTVEGVYAWDEILEIGRNESENHLERILKTIAINECCALTFTSGTTGLPKAVMLSHDNVLYGARSGCRIVGSTMDNKAISYLPMNHMTSQLTDIFMPMINGSNVYIADRNCLKTTLVDNLKSSHPSFLAGVPRVWEKLKDELTRYEAGCSFLRRRIISLAKQVALAHHTEPDRSYPHNSTLYKVFRNTVYKSMKSVVGLDNCHKQIITSALYLPEIANYFASLDAPLIDVYGMSEASGIIVAERVRDDVMQVKILNPDSDGNGEVCYNGRGVCMGYLEEEQKTIETIEEDGWIHSGDIATLNEKGEIKITGRIKELVITAGGENVLAPLIEDALKSKVPIISNAVLIGDKNKYLTILITLKSEMDPATGIPLNELAQDTKEWYRSLGCDYNTVTEIIENKHEQVYQAIQDGINRTNEEALSNAQKVQKFRILPRDFSMATDELNPSLKLKRFIILEKYAEVIDQMYRNDDH